MCLLAPESIIQALLDIELEILSLMLHVVVQASLILVCLTFDLFSFFVEL